jgi:hypothetical protein
MSNSLRKFVTKTLHNNRIGFGDLRRLERDILPVGITTPFEAEVLIALDRTIRRADRRWSDYLFIADKEFYESIHPVHTHSERRLERHVLRGRLAST